MQLPHHIALQVVQFRVAVYCYCSTWSNVYSTAPYHASHSHVLMGSKHRSMAVISWCAESIHIKKVFYHCTVQLSLLILVLGIILCHVRTLIPQQFYRL